MKRKDKKKNSISQKLKMILFYFNLLYLALFNHNYLKSLMYLFELIPLRNDNQ